MAKDNKVGSIDYDSNCKGKMIKTLPLTSKN